MTDEEWASQFYDRYGRTAYKEGWQIGWQLGEITIPYFRNPYWPLKKIIIRSGAFTYRRVPNNWQWWQWGFDDGKKEAKKAKKTGLLCSCVSGQSFA